VRAVDPATRHVILGERVLDYDDLVFCIGSSPRRLPNAIGGDLTGVFAVRSIADVDAMRPRFVAGDAGADRRRRLIGLEAAAVAAKLGLQVTLLEMAPRILPCVAALEASDYFRSIHRVHGVDLREGVGLKTLIGSDGRVTGAELSDGSTLAVDFVIAGVGIVPETALAEVAGGAIENGIQTDAMGRTAVPHLWAAGDCASFPYHGEQLRLESVGNAIEQAELVADNILGDERTYVAKPWFWSDQYDAKLQIAGLNTGYDRVVARRSGMAVSHWYYAGGRLFALGAMNDTRAYMVGKRLIEAGKSPAPEVLGDPGADLKILLKD